MLLGKKHEGRANGHCDQDHLFSRRGRYQHVRRVQAAIDITSDPPEGLIFHWAGEVDGKWTITDLWESREAYDRFRDHRLAPAIQQVSGMDPASGPQPTITEFAVHNFVKP